MAHSKFTISSILKLERPEIAHVQHKLLSYDLSTKMMKNGDQLQLMTFLLIEPYSDS